MLLERLGPDTLRKLPDTEACQVVGTLYGRIHVPALPQLRTLTSYLERGNEQLARLPRGAPLPRRLIDQAIVLSRELIADPASASHVIHGDLHYGNVLTADREPWLAIDPKPINGDRHYEVAPMLWS